MEKPKYPSQKYTQRLLDQNIIYFSHNELIDEDEEGKLEHINYYLSDGFVMFYNQYNIFSIAEVYYACEFENYIVNYTNDVFDSDDVNNIEDIVIYKRYEI